MKIEYHKSEIKKLQDKLELINERIDKAYAEKLDGRITQEFWGRQSNRWIGEKHRILRDIEEHERENQIYLDESIKLLGRCQRPYEVWENGDQETRRKALNIVLSQLEFDGMARNSGLNSKKPLTY